MDDDAVGEVEGINQSLLSYYRKNIYPCTGVIPSDYHSQLCSKKRRPLSEANIGRNYILTHNSEGVITPCSQVQAQMDVHYITHRTGLGNGACIKSVTTAQSGKYSLWVA